MTTPSPQAPTLARHARAWQSRHDRCWVRSTLDLRGRPCEVARIDWWPHTRDGHVDTPYRVSMLHNLPPLGHAVQPLPHFWYATLTEALAAADSMLAFHGWSLQ